MAGINVNILFTRLTDQNTKAAGSLTELPLPKTYFMKNFTILIFALTLLVNHLTAQQGYIYIHNKTLDESSAVDFTYSVSGGITPVPDFMLNDRPDNILIRDIGSSQNGRLWAVSNNNTLYYRDMGSADWVQTAVTTANGRIDGGSGGQVTYISGQQVFTFNGTTSTALNVNNAAFGGSNPADVANTWGGTVYITTAAGALWRYTSGSWIRVGTSTNNTNRLDADPVTGNAIVGKTGGNVYRITSGGVETNLGKPAGVSSGSVGDIAVDASGAIYGVYSIGSTAYVYKFLGGTGWSTEEVTSRRVAFITAGIGGQVWLRHQGSGTGFTQPVFSRSTDGNGNIWWIDDERVRTSPAAGNAQMFEVIEGTYTITETVPGGWDLQKIEIFDPTNNSTADLVSNSVTLNVSSGETVHVIFTNGLVNSFAMDNSCTNIYIEDFGTGAVGTYGPPMTGQTSYHHQDVSGSAEDGYYKVISRVTDIGFGPGSPQMYDHTDGTGNGRMMVVNASYDKNDFFRRRFSGLIPGASYNFSAWIASIFNSGIKPNVTFQAINPGDYSILASVSTGDISGYRQWNQYGLTFVPTSSSIDLLLVNNTIGGTGNDLALDDITLAISPPSTPATVANTACGSSAGNITVTYPVGAAYEYSINDIDWQSSPDFTNLTAGIYTVYTRYASATDCISSITDTVKHAVCGNVFNDSNGLTDNTVNGPGTDASATLYAILYDNTEEKVTDTVKISSDGSFSLKAVAGNSASIYISATPATIGQETLPVVSFPGGWKVTGENNCGITPACAGHDGIADGILSLGIITVPVTEANFGADQQPFSNNILQTVAYPAGAIIGAGAITSDVEGTDPEQGTLNGSNAAIIIDVLPGNAIMLYNAIPVNAGDTITGFNSSLLSFENITTGSVSVEFDYSFLDDAGVKSEEPGTFVIHWGTPLPVTLKRFEVYKQGNTALLQWTTAAEQNNSGFSIEHSADSREWKSIGFVSSLSANGNSSIELSYTFNDKQSQTGINYYRLRQIDFDGTYSYSPVRAITFISKANIHIYPNPAKDVIKITGLKGNETVHIMNITGQRLRTLKASGNTLPADIQQLPSGMYFIHITDTSGKVVHHEKLMKK
ncbi:MAG: T9SS type A sorting domain-containing protein [Chitinophagaceae bacterium]|nr:T9SS type A sorting domain-containing protein [Chitinophagaceae bacterium]